MDGKYGWMGEAVQGGVGDVDARTGGTREEEVGSGAQETAGG